MNPSNFILNFEDYITYKKFEKNETIGNVMFKLIP